MSAPIRLTGTALVVAIVLAAHPTAAQELPPPEIVAVCGTYFEGPTSSAATDPCSGVAQHAYYLDLAVTPDVAETITVQVDWQGSPGNVTFNNVAPDSVTPNTATKSYNMSADFEAGDKLTIEATNTNGSTQVDAYFAVVDPPITLDPDNWQQTGSNELKYEGAIQFTPDSLTANLGNSSVSADIPGFGEGILGVDIGLAPSMEIRGDGVAVFALEVGPNDNGNESEGDAGRVKFKWGIKLGGGWRFVDGWAFDEAMLELKAGLEVAAPPDPIQFVVPIPPLTIPAYYDGQLTLIADITLLIDGIADGTVSGESDPMFNGILGFEPAYEAMLGIGVKKADLYFEGFARVTVRVEVQYPDTPPLKLVRVVGATGARAKLWIFEWESPTAECWYSFVEGTEEPNGGCTPSWGPSAGARATAAKSWVQPWRSLSAGRGLRQSTSSEPLLPRTYDRTFVGTSDSSGLLEQPIVTDTFPLSQPSLVAVGEDLLLAWIDDDDDVDTGRASADRTELVFSRWDKTSDSWSQPAPIDDDGTVDFAVDMASFSGGAVAAWENASSQNTETDVNLGSVASKLQISASTYGGTSWGTPTTFGTTTVADEMPKVAAADGTAMLTWLAAQAAGFAPSREIRWATFNGTLWTCPGCEAGQDPPPGAVAVEVGDTMNHEIISYDLAYNSLGAWLVWVVDTDNQDTTLDDREIFGATYNSTTSPPSWTVVQLTNDPAPGVEDENPQLSVSVDATGTTATVVLIWYRDGDLVTKSGTGFDDTAFGVAVAPDTILDRAGASSRVADFTLIEDGPGPLALVWQFPSEKLVDLRYMVLDEANGTCSTSGTLCQSDTDCPGTEECIVGTLWSRERQLTTDEAMEHSVTGVILSDGTGPTGFALAYNDVGITRSSTTVMRDGGPYTVELPGGDQTDLMILRHVTTTDVVAEPGSMTMDHDPLNPTAPVTLHGRVVNVGDKPVSDLQVGFHDGPPGVGRAMQLCTATIVGPLVGGEAAVVTATGCQLPLQPQSPEIFMQIGTVSGETETLNNVTSAALAAPDLVIGEMWVTQWDECSRNIYLTVQNIGTSSTGQNSVVLLFAQGSVIASLNVPPLDAGQVSDTLFFYWAVPEVGVLGIFDVVGEADALGFVAELDEDNNLRSVQIDRNLGDATDTTGNGVPDGCRLPTVPEPRNPFRPAAAVVEVEGRPFPKE